MRTWLKINIWRPLQVWWLKPWDYPGSVLWRIKIEWYIYKRKKSCIGCQYLNLNFGGYQCKHLNAFNTIPVMSPERCTRWIGYQPVKPKWCPKNETENTNTT